MERRIQQEHTKLLRSRVIGTRDDYGKRSDWLDLKNWRSSHYPYHYNKIWCKRIKRTNNEKNRSSDIHRRRHNPKRKTRLWRVFLFGFRPLEAAFTHLISMLGGSEFRLRNSTLRCEFTAQTRRGLWPVGNSLGNLLKSGNIDSLQNKRMPCLAAPTGTFSEPRELSGTQADSGCCPPVVLYASNRLISSISVICFIMRGVYNY